MDRRFGAGYAASRAMTEPKDDLTELDQTLPDHPGKLRLPSAHEVQRAVDSVKTVEEPQKPPGGTAGRSIRVTIPSNPTIPVEPPRMFNPAPSRSSPPAGAGDVPPPPAPLGLSEPASNDPTIVVPPSERATQPVDIRSTMRRDANPDVPAPPSGNAALVPVLAGALAVAILVIVWLLARD